jgi:ribonuclease E
MNAKMRANFINSVAEGQTVPCPNCNAANPVDAKFCGICGTPLKKAPEPTVEPAAEPVPERESTPTVVKAEPVSVPAAEPQAPAAAETAESAAPAPKTAAFAPIMQQKNEETVTVPMPQVPQPPVVEEPKAAFAEGLPEWNIEPPQVVVRKKARK